LKLKCRILLLQFLEGFLCIFLEIFRFFLRNKINLEIKENVTSIEKDVRKYSADMQIAMDKTAKVQKRKENIFHKIQNINQKQNETTEVGPVLKCKKNFEKNTSEI